MVVGGGWEGIVRYEMDDMEVKRELEWQIDDIVTIAVYQVVCCAYLPFKGVSCCKVRDLSSRS